MSALALYATAQSTLHPAGPEASEVARLTALMTTGAAVVWLSVLGLMVLALRRGRRPHWLADRRLLVGGGIIAPTVLLGVLLVSSLLRPARLPASGKSALTIAVTGQQWWWRLHYLDGDGRVLFESANELVLPVGARVDLKLRSADVLHSFWVPALAGKLDLVPGRENRLQLRADRVGDFRGQCAEYCGGPHAWMALWVRTRPAAVYATWLQAQTQSHRAPAGHPGEAVFIARCGSCHTVRGSAAGGTRGPDLTHFASRQTLGAARLDNDAQGRAHWLESGQQLKPGNLMPEFS